MNQYLTHPQASWGPSILSTTATQHHHILLLLLLSYLEASLYLLKHVLPLFLPSLFSPASSTILVWFLLWRRDRRRSKVRCRKDRMVMHYFIKVCNIGKRRDVGEGRDKKRMIVSWPPKPPFHPYSVMDPMLWFFSSAFSFSSFSYVLFDEHRLLFHPQFMSLRCLILSLPFLTNPYSYFPAISRLRKAILPAFELLSTWSSNHLYEDYSREKLPYFLCKVMIWTWC